MSNAVYDKRLISRVYKKAQATQKQEKKTN